MLTSVWTGNDADLLLEIIPFYQRCEKEQLCILDATWGNGRFWKKRPANWRVIGLDNDCAKKAAILGDNRNLPFQRGVFDVIVYDPPHVTHSWSDWDQSPQYGFANGILDISYLYQDFVSQAAGSIKSDGLLLAKLSDQIHSFRYWWQTKEYLNVLEDSAFTPCDLIVKVRAAPRAQPPGRRQLHARRRHSYWVIARKGKC